MSKRFINAAILYAIVAMVGGVFYREFTKFLGFEGQTTLSVVHTHYFTLGMLFFLVLALLQNAFPFRGRKGVGIALALYHAGLNVTVLGLVLRGLMQATGTTIARGMDAALSGISGLGHMALSVGLLWLLVAAAQAAGERERAIE